MEESISPYLLWELHSLLVRYQCGGKIRVVGPELIERFEQDVVFQGAIFPEIVTIGAEVVYQVLYGKDGGAEGAIRALDRTTVEYWVKLAQELYAQGENLDSFFARQVAGRRPPNAKPGTKA